MKYIYSFPSGPKTLYGRENVIKIYKLPNYLHKDKILIVKTTRTMKTQCAM